METQDSIMTTEEVHQFVRNPPNREPKVRTSFKKLIALDQAATAYTNRHSEETKLGIAIKRLMNQVRPINEKFNEELQCEMESIDIDTCVTEPPDDANGKILRDAQGRYVFTRTGEKARMAKRRKVRQDALNGEDYEITPYFVSRVPDDLTDEELEAFEGFVIRPEQAEAMRQSRGEESAPA